MSKQILCANEKCSSRNCPKSIPIGNILLLIGDSYKCPYCRGDKFIMVEKDERKKRMHKQKVT